MIQFLVYNNTKRGKLCNVSQQLPRQPGWWATATFVALSQDELTMMGKEASKSRREDRGDDSDDEDDTGFQEI